jgi:single-stranded-DNA-specific exonuclease
MVFAELLVARGIASASQAFAFLNPDLAHLNDPFLMLGMTAAVERVEQAIAAHQPILLYGDYDVDGTTAVVLLKTAIEMLDGVVQFHVPHRLREGYGLQSSVLEAAYADGVRLVITVDTGMRAFAEAECARKLGLDLIITDHHLTQADDAVPHALAILNPNQPGCPYPEKSLCGGHCPQARTGHSSAPRSHPHPRQNAAKFFEDGRNRHHCRRCSASG